MYIQRKRIVADEEIIEEPVVDEVVEELPVEEEPEVDVAPEATELLFETEDVAELVAEITGLPVEVTADEDAVVFAVGEDEFTVEPEGDEEILESVRTQKKAVTASKVTVKPAVKAAKRPVEIRKNPATKK